MQALAMGVRFISRMNTILGQIFAWFSLGIVLACFTGVVLRYVFSTGYPWLQDLYVWLNAMMFMGLAGYALLNNTHVRVDIFYRPAKVRHKAWVDLIGSLVFLFPFVFTLLYWSWPYVTRSWKWLESSANYGGLPGLFIVKSFVVVFATLIALQGLAMIMRSILVLNNQQHLLPETYRYQGDTN